eukprot:CAMPEP_0175097452 /NCGR_PEP_ID=MMETSP0086_2-20121207/5294_1 /TAXON_ID=136419 /ORGANISM="Unknown Unknown, Strain D1" /LENGTH=158 /DNA_ID=CAMNT_0016370963 /DNA_START=51 /DNA_END=524 /DNA_ORIENTATION=+
MGLRGVGVLLLLGVLCTLWTASALPVAKSGAEDSMTREDYNEELRFAEKSLKRVEADMAGHHKKHKSHKRHKKHKTHHKDTGRYFKEIEMEAEKATKEASNFLLQNPYILYALIGLGVAIIVFFCFIFRKQVKKCVGLTEIGCYWLVKGIVFPFKVLW